LLKEVSMLWEVETKITTTAGLTYTLPWFAVEACSEEDAEGQARRIVGGRGAATIVVKVKPGR
jgi:hypothetical protein